MKKIIESLFHLFYPEPGNLKESEKTQFWEKTIILLIVGLLILVMILLEN